MGGGLPPGLALSSAGQITGNPSTTGSFSFTAEVSDSAARAAAGAFSVSIGPPELVISTSSLPNGSVGAAYIAALTGSGGTGPYTWALTGGTLPAGLSLNASTGAISGTPTAAIGATPLTFKLTDSESPADSATVTLPLTIAAAALQITTSSLPNGQVGTAYSATLVASGGVSPYTWILASGTLPAGLSLNSATGVVSGTPTAASNATSLTFKVTDSGSPAGSATVTLALTIGAAPTPALQITTSSLPNGQAGTAYSATLAANGGTSPYTWTLTSGMLPAGLSLNAATGVVSGTPTAASNATSLTFKVTDSASPAGSATVTLALTIGAAPTPALQITTSSLPNGQAGTAYSATLSANGGVTPYTWTLTSGTLAAGLSLNAATGVVSGTPTAASSATSLTFKVTDSASPAGSATVTLALTIAAPALQITTSSLPSGQVGTAYSATLAANGGRSPYTWTLTSGMLPAGLSLNAATGVVSGTPTAASNATLLTFKVTDSGSPAASATATLSLTIAAPALTITTTSLPDGVIGAAYSTTLGASGGTAPYSWTLTNGTLPAGLSLNTSTGAVGGTPTAASNAAPLTFQVTDSSTPASSQTSNLTLTIASSSNVVVTIAPTVATVNFTQTQQFAATVTGSSNSSVNWYVDNIAGGSAAVGTISPAGLYTPPAAVVSHKVTAISAVNSNAAVDATVYVSNSPGVLSYHNDNLRTGLNSSETVLTPSNVNSTQFGKLFSLPVDGQIFAQPLYVPSLTIGSQIHNVVFVATEHDSVYAWDADNGSQTPLWQTSFINPGTGITAVPCAEALNDCGTIYPEFGITSTPVIDTASGTIYVVAATKEVAGNTTNYVYRLHALSLITGAEKFGGPVVIQANVSGIAFDPLQHLQRPGLLLVNGVVYVAFGSHGDASPWYGWLLGYNASSLQQVMAFNTAPVAGGASIWQSGCAPAADTNGKIYFVTGNGNFTANVGGADYGDTVLKLDSNGGVTDYFTPNAQATLNAADLDLGSGGQVLVPDQTGTYPHLLITAGKQGVIYVLNRDNMGKYGATADTSLQSLAGLAGGLFGSPAFWNHFVYLAAWNDSLKAFQLNDFTLSQSSSSAMTFAFPGATPSVSANGNTNGIVWAIQADVQNNTVLTTVPNAVLHAFDATNVARELYNSGQAANGRDTAGGAVKFAVPTVADGRVYVGNSNQVTVYGLLP